VTGVRLRHVGDAGLLVEVGDATAAHAVRAALLAAAIPGVRELVVGARSVLAVVDPLVTDPGAVLAAAAGASTADAAPGRLHRIPVRYDGADLAEVADLVGLSTVQVVRRHASAEYTVAFLGFAPGFGYLTGLDPILRVPRRATPRERVPAGAVAIAGEHTAVYPRPTPGGWRLLGRTDASVFDPLRDPPALLAPGDRVRFVAE
jgi:KipI family sensor histidine kinase inhibitor